MRRPARRAAIASGVALLAVYIATLAPDVTFWDAGEFIAAAHSLGIPHPPGTPLFVLALHVWARAVAGPLRYAVATNLFSAVCTAAVAALSASLLARRLRDPWGAVGAALCAGGMSTVWLNATETEVYAASLALAACTLWCADRTGRTYGARSSRWRLLTGYLVVLAVPVHLSALVAAPAAIVLAATRDAETVDWRTALTLTGVLALAVGVGRMSAWTTAVGVALVLAARALAPPLARIAERLTRLRSAAAMGTSSANPRSGPPPADESDVPAAELRHPPAATRILSPLRMLAVSAVGLSALAFLILRARHDPPLNQGNPSTLQSLAFVVARRQYDVAPLWPRRAPLWLQLANVFDWADWQVALSLGPSVIPTPARTALSLVFGALGVYGAARHRRADPRSWRALATLLLCGSLGVAIYLNLAAGPSFGWGVLPDGAVREARERDYFFVLGFWAWGLWAGLGAVMLTRVALRRAPAWPRLRVAVGLAVAALPIGLNWSVVSRRTEPGASLPRMFATSLLGSAPRDAVLFVAGDNDTYPLWYLQEVGRVRRDVIPVTIPLLGTAWYERELSRRHDLLPRFPSGELPWIAAPVAIADQARALGRPVAVSMAVDAATRNRIGRAWTARGMVYVSGGAGRSSSGDTAVSARGRDGAGPAVDAAVTRYWSERIAAWRGGRDVGPSTDPIDRYAMSLLECPSRLLAPRGDRARLVAPRDTAPGKLDSLCNYR